METNITLYGASGHAKVIIDILTNCALPISAVVDDNPKTETILQFPIIKSSDFDFNKVENMIISIGNNKVRKKISTKLTARYVTAIHPSAVISKDCKIGVGTVLMAGVILNPDATIGMHCIINTGAIVEHDCCIENFAHVSPGVSLAGNVSVGEGTHIGIGATVIQGVKIGKWAIIGAGTVVIRDVPDCAVVVGNPGKIIKYIQQND